jgi:hypothetical protein
MRTASGPGWPGIGLALVVLCLGARAEARKKSEEGVLPMRVVEVATSRGVRETGGVLEPVERSDRFATTDRHVTAFVRFEHVLKAHRLQWRWYDPDGKLYTQSSDLLVTPTGRYHETYTGAHSILLDGERAMLLPGTWKVVVFLDGVIAASTDFMLTTREG